MTAPANALPTIIALVITAHPHLAGRVTEALVFDRHDIDSLDVMALVIDAERTFDVEIDNATIDRLATVGDLADAVEARRTADRPNGGAA